MDDTSKETVTTACEVEVFSRVTGFFRPVQAWNKGKVAEFADRKGYAIKAEELADVLST